MTGTCALVPVKPFDAAKTRLASVLSREECATLARRMLGDLLAALDAAPQISSIAVLSGESRLPALPAGKPGFHFSEAPGEDWCTALSRAAAALAAHGIRQLLVVPADLPTVTAGDIGTLIAGHVATARGGVTVCPARRDGGTNALLVTPPTAIPFLYGPDSAARHLAAAAARHLPARQADVAAFAHDIDTVDDVDWLLGQRQACATLAWLKASGIGNRLRTAPRPGPADTA